jgi:hypothetical protein
VTAGIIRLQVLRGARGEAEFDRLDQLFRAPAQFRHGT